MARSKYKERKLERLNGRPMKSRLGQGDPWYTFRVPGVSPQAVSGPAALEREMSRHAEIADYRTRFAAEQAKDRAEARKAQAAEALEAKAVGDLTVREDLVIRGKINPVKRPHPPRAPFQINKVFPKLSPGARR